MREEAAERQTLHCLHGRKIEEVPLRRIVVGIIGGLLVLAAVVVGGSYLWLSCQVGRSRPPTASSMHQVLTSAPVDAIGSPTGMDILVLGCDRRPDHSGEETRSDTLILVHADPGENYLSILSLPRDLRVEIPGHGTQKLNAAYALGGTELAIRTVEELTRVDITQYVEVDFQAFSDMTDAVGGVYLDIDRRYYNDDPTFELIKISPGYQLLDGANALDYVRFRHDLNYDFGRMDRQQRFLTALREQAMGWNLLRDLPGLVGALFDNLTTSLGTNDIIRLAYWGVAKLSGDRIRQVSIVGNIREIDGVSFVIPDEGAVEEAVERLLTPPTPGGGSKVPETSQSLPESSTTTTAIDTSKFITDPNKIPNSRLWKQFAAAAPLWFGPLVISPQATVMWTATPTGGIQARTTSWSITGSRRRSRWSTGSPVKDRSSTSTWGSCRPHGSRLPLPARGEKSRKTE